MAIELIDRVALIKAINADKRGNTIHAMRAGKTLLCLQIICEHLHLAPTVDAVEVVRCRACKHGRPPCYNTSPEKYFRQDWVVCQCENVVGDEFMIYEPSHFCSYGERRTDE